MNIAKHIEFWKEGAEDAFGTAELLIRNGRRLHGLFFCHLAIEKILKAHVVKASGEYPPKTHHLPRLVEITELDIPEGQEKFLGVLMKYQIEGRYPEYLPKTPPGKIALDYLERTKQTLLWIKEKLLE